MKTRRQVGGGEGIPRSPALLGLKSTTRREAGRWGLDLSIKRLIATAVALAVYPNDGDLLMETLSVVMNSTNPAESHPVSGGRSFSCCVCFCEFVKLLLHSRVHEVNRSC